jgi:hypothetical protein
MIRTIQPVKYKSRSPELESVIYAEIINVIRKPRLRQYVLEIEEWILIPYTQEIDENQNIIGTETQTFYAKQILTDSDGNNKRRTMSYEESNNLTMYLDSIFEIQEINTDRRHKYTILGHLIINNQEQVYGSAWELVE